jgi:hypothetical protein
MASRAVIDQAIEVLIPQNRYTWDAAFGRRDRPGRQ